jgi:hypothetical protein
LPFYFSFLDSLVFRLNFSVNLLGQHLNGDGAADTVLRGCPRWPDNVQSPPWKVPDRRKREQGFPVRNDCYPDQGNHVAPANTTGQIPVNCLPPRLTFLAGNPCRSPGVGPTVDQPILPTGNPRGDPVVMVAAFAANQSPHPLRCGFFWHCPSGWGGVRTWSCPHAGECSSPAPLFCCFDCRQKCLTSEGGTIPPNGDHTILGELCTGHWRTGREPPYGGRNPNPLSRVGLVYVTFYFHSLLAGSSPDSAERFNGFGPNTRRCVPPYESYQLSNFSLL